LAIQKPNLLEGSAVYWSVSGVLALFLEIEFFKRQRRYHQRCKRCDATLAMAAVVTT